MASLSGRSTSRQMSSVRVIRQKDYGTNCWWHKPTALSTANKAHWTEQITIMKEWLKELMMTDELRRRDKEEVAWVTSKWIITTSPVMFSFSPSNSLSCTCLFGFFFYLCYSPVLYCSYSIFFSLIFLEKTMSWFWPISPFLWCFFLLLFVLFLSINCSFPPLLPPLTGILETDITFLVIFSMVFLLSCYFACEYWLFTFFGCHSFSLFFHEQYAFFPSLKGPQKSLSALFLKSIKKSTRFLMGGE